MKNPLLGKIVLGGSPTKGPKNDGIMGKCTQNDSFGAAQSHFRKISFL
jgi:hypothetical protein